MVGMCRCFRSDGGGGVTCNQHRTVRDESIQKVLKTVTHDSPSLLRKIPFKCQLCRGSWDSPTLSPCGVRDSLACWFCKC